MSGHTPGPWVVRYVDGNRPYQIDAPNGRKGPGGITSITRWAGITFPSSLEAQANARLMAAAPDLLESLKLARVIVAGADAKCTGDTAVLAKIDAAIAKATGAS